MKTDRGELNFKKCTGDHTHYSPSVHLIVWNNCHHANIAVNIVLVRV